MKSWALIAAITVLSKMRVWLRSPASIAWRLSQFELQTRLFMRSACHSAFHRLRPIIATLLICSILGPTVSACTTRSLSQLPSHVHRAWVCTRMPQVDPDARYWAMHYASNTIVDDSDPEAFDEFLPYADVVFIFDSTARAESVHVFPIPYNVLSCDDPDALIPRAVDDSPRLPHANDNPLRNAQWDTWKTTIDDVSPLHARFVASAQGVAPKKGPEIIRVCTHPPDVRSDALEWLFTTEKAGASYTRDPNLYARLRAGAKRVYVYDEDAPGESVLRFPSPHNRLRCPGKPLIADTSEDKEADKRAAFDAIVAAVMAKASVSEFGGNGGSDKRTWTSTPEGHGASLSFFESVVRQMVIAGAFQSGDVSGDLKDPNGARYGLPNGKNVGGPDSLMLQLAAGTFLLLKTPLRTTAAFGRKIAQAARQKGVLIIAEVKLFPEGIAKQLIETYGKDMAPSLHQLKTILPYSRASMFTKGWGFDYQAHKILEKDMYEKVFHNPNFENLPAIILKDAEHKKMTKRLNDVRKVWLDLQAKIKPNKAPEMTPEGLWEIYQVAYAEHPTWLRSIASYFGK